MSVCVRQIGGSRFTGSFQDCRKDLGYIALLGDLDAAQSIGYFLGRVDRRVLRFSQDPQIHESLPCIFSHRDGPVRKC